MSHDRAGEGVPDSCGNYLDSKVERCFTGGMTENQYPIVKFGSKWMCDGPEGRFFAHTKAEAIRLLNETGGAYDEQVAQDNVKRNLRGSK